MDIPLGPVLNGFDAFILVFVRMTGLFVIAPIFGRRNIPTYLKIGFSMLLALILVNTIKIPNFEYYDSVYQYVFLVTKEFLVGLVLGYIAYLVFSAIYLAGQLVDMQVGFGMVNVMDPLSNIQVSITSNFYYIITMLIFLSIKGHHVLIKGLFDSYKHIPIDGAVFTNGLMLDIMRIFSNMLIIAIQIAAPVLVAILITDIVLGVISKTIPQLNVFVIGMPLKIALGLAVIILTIPIFISFMSHFKDLVGGEMLNFMKHMGK